MASTLARTAVQPNYGRFATESETIADLVVRLVGALDPQMIWLFGSRARGDARVDSDFDFLVVSKEEGTFGCDDYDMVYAPVMGTGIGVDVIPCEFDVYHASLGLRTSLVRRIVDEGRLVYGSDAG